ncbi:MAG: response regulator [Treponema sp.]|nr:response regulator [Treponema sp.]
MISKITKLLKYYAYSEDIPLDTRFINVLCLIGVAGIFFAMIARIIMGAGPIVIVIFAVLQLMILLTMYAANRLRSFRNSNIISIILLCFILCPLAFFFLGGTLSVIESYFALSMVIIFLLSHGPVRVALTLAQILIVFVCHFVNYRYPDFIYRLGGGSEYLVQILYLDRFLGYLVIGLSVGSIISLQSRFFKSEKEKGELAGHDLKVALQTINAVLDSNPHLNVLFDSGFRVVDCNPAAMDYLGFANKEEFRSSFAKRIGEVIPKFQSSGKPSVPLSDRLKTAANEGSVRFETELHFPNEIRVMDAEFKRIPYEDSYGIVGYLVDITAVRRTERELVRRDRLLAAVNSAASVITSDAAFDEILYNSLGLLARGAELDRIHVWHSVEVNGQKTYVMVQQWSNETGNEKMRVDMGLGMPYSGALAAWEEKFSRDEYVNGPLHALSGEEQAVLTPFGVVSILIIPVYLQNKFWGFFSFDDCHSERVFGENELNILQSGCLLIAGAILRNEMTNSITDNAARMKSIISNYSGVIWSVNKDGTITNFDGRYLEKIGVTPDFIEGKNIEQVKGKNRHFDLLQNVLDTLTDGKDREWVGDIDGGQFHHRVTALVGADSEIFGVMGNTDDITETLRLQNDLKNAVEEAQAASRAKSEFLSNMSHEIRTPMNAIIGMTSIGKNSGDVDRKDYAFGKIEDASTHLLGIINDILDMSKIEAGKFELSFEEFNFEKMLRKVSDVMVFRMDEKQQKFMVRIDRNIPRMLISDDQRIAQVITNLLSNAVKFTPESGLIKLNVVFVQEENDIVTLRIEVKDSGIGISPEQQARLFKSFQQAESSTTRKYGGTGLGLAISKRIVEMLGGDIWIESELGKGASFIFTMKAERSKIEHVQAAPGVGLANIRVLVVDDMVEVLDYFADIAVRQGFHCDIANSGEDALNLVEKNGSYDIYFIDWKMPNMDGMELARRLKASGSEKSVITMISSAEWGNIEGEAKAAGIERFLSKPLFPSAINDFISEYLGLDNLKKTHDSVIGASDLYEDKHLLLVEDVEINREIVLALLEPTKLNIDCAENGRIALEKYRKSPEAYDMIFMDVQMPEMDGYEATRLIREFEQEKAIIAQKPARRIPIIAMTANVFREDVEKCLAAGMNEHVGKPLSLGEVIEKLRKYLA